MRSLVVSLMFCLSLNSLIVSARQQDQSHPPAASTDVLPPIYYDSLLNGLQILIVERPGDERVTIGFMIKSGAAFDLVKKEGTADLTARLIIHRARTINDKPLAEQFEQLKVRWGYSVTWDATRFWFDVPRQNLIHLFPLLAEIFSRPAFSEEALQALKRERSAELQRQRPSSAELARRIFYREVFAGHPYARPVEGTATSVENITLADIRRHFRRFYLANNAVLIVIGNVSSEAAMPIIRPTFGALLKGKLVPATFRAPERPKGIHITLVDRPKEPEAHLYMGHLAMPRSNEDFIPFLLLTHALGGTPQSQLARLTGVFAPAHVELSSQLEAYRLYGVFSIRARMPSQQVPVVVSTLLKFIENTRTNPITEYELIAAKNYFLEHFPERLRTPRDIIEQLEDIELYHLGRDYIHSYSRRIEGVTPEQIKRVAARYLSSTDLHIVVVGRAADMEAGLRRIGTLDIVKPTSPGEQLAPQQ
ncbi:MAG: insulinase family protein [Acidobacteria bacterium]|nr:MAG: insulinase family protein [Acidobacteriota bacterium]